MEGTTVSHRSSTDKVSPSPPPPPGPLCGGKLCFSPSCVQHAQTAKWLLFWMCIAGAVQGMVVNGFVNVSITSIEKRFKLMSRSTGLIAGFYDIACVLVSVPVSYMGSRPTASKPRWVGFGLLIMGLGSFVFLLPHFLVPFYEVQPEDGDADRISSVRCNAVQNFTGSGCGSAGDPPWLSNFQYVFLLAQVLQGLGAVPLYTIGVAFIDESVPSRLSSFYLGIFYSMAVVGPAIGYGLGGQFLKVYVDAPYVDPAVLGITPSSDRWLGGWWMGFFVSGTLAILSAIPILMIPPVLPKTEDDGPQSEAGRGEGGDTKESEDDSIDVVASGATAFQHLEGMHTAVVSLLKNVPFVALSVAESTEGFLVSGLAAFMPKLIETQFGLSASLSAILVGAMAIPAGGGGVFLGGWIIKKFKMQYNDLLKVCFSFTVITLLSCFCLFLYCPNNKFAGVSMPYQMEPAPPSYPDLSSGCNTDCGCEGVSYNPVCGADNVIYYSPCHAGCKDSVFKDGKELFNGCTCIVKAHDSLNSSQSSAERPALGQASIDTCPNTCDLLVTFLIILLVLMFFTFLISMPNIAATLRCVEPEHRALALGLQGISFRLVGTIPAPILFGVAIDSACVLWQDSCGTQGSCVAYNNYYMTRYIMALGFAAKIVSCVSFFIAWRWYKPPSSDAEPARQPEGNGVAPSVEGLTGGPVLQGNLIPQTNKSTAELMSYDNLALDNT